MTNINKINLSKQLDARIDSFSEEKTLDLIERAKIGDAKGITDIGGFSRKDAISIINWFNEEEAGVRERKVLKTSDTRKLKHDILTIFAESASSELARNKILFTAPTLNLGKLGERLEKTRIGAKLYNELKKQGRLGDIKKILEELTLETNSSKKNQSTKTSDTVQYFISRKPVLLTAYDILSKFENVEELMIFFKGIDKNVLGEIIKTLDTVEDLQIKDPEAIISDSEIIINEIIRTGRIDEEQLRRIVEEKLEEITFTLKLNFEEETALRRAALGHLAIPFEFDRVLVKKFIGNWVERQSEEHTAKTVQIDSSLRRQWTLTEHIVEKTVLLDQELAIATTTEKYSLKTPTITAEGIGFINGQNIFLLRDQLKGEIKDIQPVNYSLGRTKTTTAASHRNVVMLTGANSGGKTTLLTTLAAIHILTLLGMPVPCEKAEVTPMPIYLFRRRITKKIGSLEQALKSLIPVFADRQRKLVLMDEFEALTEPGAAGRIVATIVNRAATSSSLVLLITHLARETLPHVKLPIRIDGIEAKGLDKAGELIVDRQPAFDHIGSSTPKFIVKKLAKSEKKKRIKSLYEEILNSLEGDSSTPVQTPLVLPWTK